MFNPVLNAAMRAAQVRRPYAVLYDLREDLTDLTTYTFTNCILPPVSANPYVQTATGDNDNLIHSPGHVLTLIGIHAEDALSAYTVSSVTVGGQTASSGRDNGGLQAISSAIFFLNANRRQEATGSDIVVTFSEAITGCAISVVGVHNVASNSAIPFGTGSSATATGVVTVSLQGGTARTCVDTAMSGFVISTCATGGGTTQPQCTTLGSRSGLYEPVMLYSASNVEFDYAGWFAYSPQMMMDAGADAMQTVTSWSGSNTKDAAGVAIF